MPRMWFQSIYRPVHICMRRCEILLLRIALREEHLVILCKKTQFSFWLQFQPAIKGSGIRKGKAGAHKPQATYLIQFWAAKQDLWPRANKNNTNCLQKSEDLNICMLYSILRHQGQSATHFPRQITPEIMDFKNSYFLLFCLILHTKQFPLKILQKKLQAVFSNF